MHLDDQPQLLVDNALIESTQGLARRWHKPRRQGDAPLIVRDRPWEQAPFFTYSNHIVLRDPLDGLFKCWYEDLGGELTDDGASPRRTRLLYAESEDGLVFRKPALDVCTFAGTPTNVVMGHLGGRQAVDNRNPWAQEGVHSNGLVIDPHPSRADARFLTVFVRAELSAGQGIGMRHSTACAHSPDGIHWKPYRAAPAFGSSPGGLGDVTCLHYDPEGRMFVLNTRHGLMSSAALPEGTPDLGPWFNAYYPQRPDLNNKRRVHQTRSADFLHWTEPLPVSVPDDAFDNLDEGHYGMQQFQVGGMHFATLGILRYVDNEMEVRLLYSRDGIHFHPADRGQPFLAPRGIGHWDAHMVSMTSPPVEVGDEWWFYHGGSSGHHDVKIPGESRTFGLGLARLRKDGLASLAASEHRDGYFITRPLSGQYRNPSASRLRINACCRRSGSVRMALLDQRNRPLDGFSLEDCEPFQGDDVAQEVRWRGHGVGSLGEAWVKLHVQLRHAEIFAFRFD